MLHTRIHLHTVLADMDIEPHPPEPEWAPEEEVLERGGGSRAPAMQEDTALGEQAEPGLQEEKRGALLSFAHVPFKGHEKQLPPFIFFFFFKLFRAVMQHYIHCISCVWGGRASSFGCRILSPDEEEKWFESPTLQLFPDKPSHPGHRALYDVSHACFSSDFLGSGVSSKK